MNQIIIPELVLLDSLERFNKFIYSEYNSHSDYRNSFLYKILSTPMLDRFKLFQSGKSLFIDNFNTEKAISVSLGMTISMNKPFSMFITLPGESEQNNALSNSIYQGVVQPYELVGQTQYGRVVGRRFASTYDIVLVAQNSNSMIVSYHVYKTLFISILDHLHLSGLENISMSGKDVRFHPELIPLTSVTRAISLKFENNITGYEVANLFSLINELDFTGEFSV